MSLYRYLVHACSTFSAEGGPEGEVVGEERILAEKGAARILHAHHALTLPIKACAKIQGRRLGSKIKTKSAIR